MKFFWGMVVGVLVVFSCNGIYALGKSVGKAQAEEAYNAEK